MLSESPGIYHVVQKSGGRQEGTELQCTSAEPNGTEMTRMLVLGRSYMRFFFLKCYKDKRKFTIKSHTCKFIRPD